MLRSRCSWRTRAAVECSPPPGPPPGQAGALPRHIRATASASSSWYSRMWGMAGATAKGRSTTCSVAVIGNLDSGRRRRGLALPQSNRLTSPRRRAGAAPAPLCASRRASTPAHSSLTRAAVRSMRAASSTSRATPATSRPISRNSSGPKPKVVAAGLPRRIPLGLTAVPVSPGTVFLFTTRPARSRAAAVFRPAGSAPSRRTSTRWLSVPPETSRRPSARRDSASAAAFCTTCREYSLKAG